MDSNTAKTHEDVLKNIIKTKTIKKYNYPTTGYFRRVKKLDPENQKDLIDWAEYNLFANWAKECAFQKEQKKPPEIKNEEMPILDHQVLRNLYFGAYPNSTKARNSLRKMVKTYKEKYHIQEPTISSNRFSDILEQKKPTILHKTEVKFRENLRKTDV